MADFLRRRNGNYYFRLRIPADLHPVIPDTEILKSLRTRDRKTARLSAACMLPNFLKVFSLSRCGILTTDQTRMMVANLLGRQPEIDPETNAPEVQSPLPQITAPVLDPTPTPALAPTPTSPNLQNLIDQYTNDHRNEWTAKTRLEYESYYRLIFDIIGNRSVSEINRETVRYLRDTLSKLPSNVYKKHPGKSIRQVLSLSTSKLMSVTTVNKLLGLFGSLMRHSIKEGYRTDNPTEGLKLKQKRRADEQRKIYTTEDLKKITAALPSPTTIPERYWVPMIGMFTGMRLGEICGLHVADVKQVIDGSTGDAVWCVDVNEEAEKRLKTLSSTRLIPVHPKLIDMGLLIYVETMREKKSVRLFPRLVRRDIDGYCPALGNWYGRFNRKYITNDPLKTFHSLRHSFADTLKQQGVQESVISELMGHANDSITTGRYGKRYQPRVLLEAIVMLQYD